jgi:hypothetical protein
MGKLIFLFVACAISCLIAHPLADKSSKKPRAGTFPSGATRAVWIFFADKPASADYYWKRHLEEWAEVNLHPKSVARRLRIEAYVFFQILLTIFRVEKRFSPVCPRF